ncbi:MAG TPA: zinc ribbon domain-containing protein [bacterium]
MPIYEFECMKCGNKFEELVLGSSNKAVCSKCSSKKVHKIVSAFGMKSGGKFIPSSGSACGPCAGGSCSTCG